MKISIYTSVIHIQDKHTLIYNSLSGKFIIVKNRCLDLKDLDNLYAQEDSGTFSDQLRDAEVVIEDTRDEITILTDRIKDADRNKNEFILHVNPTLDCNFSCWYCYENHIRKSGMDSNTIKNVADLISRILEKEEIKKLHLSFFGGEPLLYFKDIVKVLITHSANTSEILDKKLSVSFTSNGSLLNSDMINFLSEFDCSFQITLDGGRERHNGTRYFQNKKGSYDLILTNILKLLKAGIKVLVRVNYTGENIDSVESILHDFADVDPKYKDILSFDFQRVWQDTSDRNDQCETKIKRTRLLFADNGLRVMHNYLRQDVRNSCYGDKENHALVNYNGDVFACTARDFNENNRIGILKSEGVIEYETEKLKKRNNSKFSRKVCKTCRIAPVCGGGCKQKAMETDDYNHGGCPLGFTSEDIDDMILEIMEYLINFKE